MYTYSEYIFTCNNWPMAHGCLPQVLPLFNLEALDLDLLQQHLLFLWLHPLLQQHLLFLRLYLLLQQHLLCLWLLHLLLQHAQAHEQLQAQAHQQAQRELDRAALTTQSLSGHDSLSTYPCPSLLQPSGQAHLSHAIHRRFRPKQHLSVGRVAKTEHIGIFLGCSLSNIFKPHQRMIHESGFQRAPHPWQSHALPLVVRSRLPSGSRLRSGVITAGGPHPVPLA